MAIQNLTPGVIAQLSAQLVHEVREVDEADPRTAPQLIMHLRDGRDARAGIFQRISNFERMCATCLNLEQADNGGEAVLDAMAHFPCKQVLIFDRLDQLRVCLLTFNGDAQQSRKSRQKIGIGVIELAGIGAVDLQNAERSVSFATHLDQDVDDAPPPMISEKFGNFKSELLLKI